MISTVFFPRVTDQFQEQYNIPIQLLEYGSIRARTLVDNEQLDVLLLSFITWLLLGTGCLCLDCTNEVGVPSTA